MPVSPSKPWLVSKWGMTSRHLFYVQVAILLLCIAGGMAESYTWLRWGAVLHDALPIVLFASIPMPLVILLMAGEEKRSIASIAGAVALSAIMTIASILALLPACM